MFTMILTILGVRRDFCSMLPLDFVDIMWLYSVSEERCLID